MGEALIVHQVAEQCSSSCELFVPGFVFLWLLVPAVDRPRAAAAVKAGPPPQDASCCRPLLWGFIRLRYTRAQTQNPLVFLTL